MWGRDAADAGTCRGGVRQLEALRGLGLSPHKVLLVSPPPTLPNPDPADGPPVTGAGGGSGHDDGLAWVGLAGLREAAGPVGSELDSAAADWELSLLAAAAILEPPAEAATLPVSAAAGRG